MWRHISANLWLAGLTLLLGSVLYPLALFGVGQTLFPFQAQGSLIDKQGRPTNDLSKAVGSRLIGQPFSRDEYFQPRPSAPSYNAAASGASNWGPSSYQLRDRVARALGPIVKYSGGAKKGQPVGSDVESWFREDRYQGKPGIVARWASDHGTLAQRWITDDTATGDVRRAYIHDWMKTHPALLADWKKENPGADEPKPEDLAVPFFQSFSKEQPGKWPTIVDHKTAAGATEKQVEPVSEGSDIQSGFFDMWRQEHPDAELQEVPADLVMASGSGLDPDITLAGAMYQLDRVAAAWAATTHQPEPQIRREIEAMLQQQATEPLGGLVGVKLINVLEINLALSGRYGATAEAKP